ncbi:MAG: hypothetical protein A2748_01400 [Candidatus Wildermuthbacteria bacterium RIFCSPHIGHO2_01_FULL_45_20]|nr:MAG: hypothetical protein A2748_01400 [Candidatus Wildermuthbacteria bacterium RIFCSPHIGHO2_01_FULL_45_20]
MAMNNYLIEGLSGTGKSSVCKELQKMGYRAIDADQSFSYFKDPKTELPTQKINQFYLTWDTKKVEEALAHTTEPTFVCGGLVDMEKFMPYFKQIFILRVDNETLRKRLLTRKNNDFGKYPEDLQRQLEWNKGVEEYAKQKGATLIDATKPLSQVAQEILKYVEVLSVMSLLLKIRDVSLDKH